MEFDARPGTPLGGPFTTRPTARHDLQRVWPDEILALHYTYLRKTYLSDSTVREQLDLLAGPTVRGSARTFVISADPAVASSVVEAARRLVTRLSPLTREED